MHLKKLISVLRSLDKDQLKRLREYVDTPYFKVPPHSVTLFHYLAPANPALIPAEISVEVIAGLANNLSTPAKQSRAGSHLFQAIEKFMAIEHLEKNPGQMAWHSLSAYKSQHLFTPFAEKHKKELKKINRHADQDVTTFFDRHTFTELGFSGFNARLNRSQHNNLQPVIKTLDEFHALKKLRYLCEQLNRERVLGIPPKNEEVPALLKTLEPFTNRQYPYVYLFVNVYRMLEEPTFAESRIYYQMLKRFIQNQSGTAPADSISEAADYTLNHCLHWYNKGLPEAGTEYLWWIEWKRKNNLLLQNGRLTPPTFVNIISIAVVSGISAAQIQKLITTYAPCLPAPQHHTFLTFAQGLYAYKTKKPKNAVRLFLQAQAGKDNIFNCIIRRWHWISLYELDPADTDALVNHLDSFDKYLHRHKKELHNRYQPLRQFLVYAELLLNSNGPKFFKALDELKAQEYFPGSHWLIHQFSIRATAQKKGARQKQFA